MTNSERQQLFIDPRSAFAELIREHVAQARAEAMEEAARIAEDERVIRAMPPYDGFKPMSGNGWNEIWPHAGYRIAAAIREAAKKGGVS